MEKKEQPALMILVENLKIFFCVIASVDTEESRRILSKLSETEIHYDYGAYFFVTTEEILVLKNIMGQDLFIRFISWFLSERPDRQWKILKSVGINPEEKSRKRLTTKKGGSHVRRACC